MCQFFINEITASDAGPDIIMSHLLIVWAASFVNLFSYLFSRIFCVVWRWSAAQDKGGQILGGQVSLQLSSLPNKESSSTIVENLKFLSKTVITKCLESWDIVIALVIINKYEYLQTAAFYFGKVLLVYSMEKIEFELSLYRNIHV